MFDRNIEKLSEIYNKHKSFFVRIDDVDDELYVAYRTDQKKNYISIYCGSVVFATVGINKIYADGINRIKGAGEFFAGLENAENKFDYYIEKRQLLKDAIYDTEFYKRNQERKRQIKIAKNHGKEKKVCVLDVETAIPSDNGVKNKNPEIDMVVYDSEKNILYLTEYKCNDITLSGETGVEGHYSDMKKVLENEELKKAIVAGQVGIYEMLTSKKVDKSKTDVKIAFCFTELDKVTVNKSLKKIEDNEVAIWAFPKAESVDFSKDPIPVKDYKI